MENFQELEDIRQLLPAIAEKEEFTPPAPGRGSAELPHSLCKNTAFGARECLLTALHGMNPRLCARRTGCESHRLAEYPRCREPA